MSSQRFSNASYNNQQRRTEAGAKNVIAGFIDEVSDPTGTTNMLLASNREVLTSPNTAFSDLGGGSVDTVFSPFQIDGGSSKLPTYPTSASSTCVPAQSNHVDPPIDQWTPPTVNVQYLNPFKRPSDPQHSDTAGDTYDGQIIFNGGTSDRQNLVSRVHLNGESFPTDLRPVAIRGPIVIQGWGYDLNGKPIPNKIDSAASARAGTFQDAGLKDKFLDNHMQKRETWPVAPLDVRYDRQRKVWTVPQTFRMIRAVAPTGIQRGSSADNVVPQDIDAVYDSNGNTVNFPTITVNNPSFQRDIDMAEEFFAFYDTRLCDYYGLVTSPALCWKVQRESGCIAEDLDVDGINGYDEDYLKYKGMILGDGLVGSRFTDGTADCGGSGIRISTIHKFGGNYFSNIALQGGLTLYQTPSQSGTCDYTLSGGGGGCTDGGTANVQFVHDICCSGSGLDIRYGTIGFVDGCFTGVAVDSCVSPP